MLQAPHLLGMPVVSHILYSRDTFPLPAGYMCYRPSVCQEGVLQAPACCQYVWCCIPLACRVHVLQAPVLDIHAARSLLVRYVCCQATAAALYPEVPQAWMHPEVGLPPAACFVEMGRRLIVHSRAVERGMCCRCYCHEGAMLQASPEEGMVASYRQATA